MTSRWVVVVAIAAACASGRRPGEGGGGDDGAGAQHDAAPGAIDAPGTGVDARKLDGGTGGTGLDPELELPDPNGQVCHHPRAFNECPSPQVCRYFSPTEGRCEECPGGCGGLNQPCTATNQCDTPFECYQHTCVGFCILGSVECGAVSDCVDIGFPGMGVCKPS